MKFSNKILKTLILSMMLTQAPAHADLWSSISSKCTQLWKDNKVAMGISIGLISIAALTYGYKRYNASQKTRRNHRNNNNAQNADMTKQTDRQSNFAPKGVLSVQGLCGNVTVQGIDNDTITIRAVKKATCLAALRNTQVVFSDNYHEIRTRYRPDFEDCSCSSGIFHFHPNGQRSHQCAVNYTIQVPRSTSINASTQNGTVNVTDCQFVRARSSNGSIAVKKCGTVNTNTSNGKITIEDCGDVQARTSNAGIVVNKCQKAYAQTSNGSIQTCECQSSEAYTSNGNIVVTQTPLITNVRTSNGTITVDGRRVNNGYHS